MIIRRAILSDVVSLVRLLKQLFALEKDFVCDVEKQTAGFKLLVESWRDIILVAETEKEVIGCLTAQVHISTAEGGYVATVEDIIVDAAYRGKGVGSMLEMELCKWAKESGLRRLQLLADKDNAHAHAFYTSRGWLETNLVSFCKKLSC